MSASSSRHAQPVSARRDGVLIEFWQMPSGQDEHHPVSAGALYVDTRFWRTERRVDGVDPRLDHLNHLVKQVYAVGMVYVHSGAAHPYDMTNPGYIMGLFVRGFTLDDISERSPLAPDERSVTACLILTPQTLRQFFLSATALRLRIFMREGDTPAHWWCEWVYADATEVYDKFEIGATDDEAQRVAQTVAQRLFPTDPTSPAATGLTGPMSEATEATTSPMDPLPDAATIEKRLRALKARYQRDPAQYQ